jgi:2-methoxy-6-polyprenyl-1,4-benzoquinol methylase
MAVNARTIHTALQLNSPASLQCRLNSTWTPPPQSDSTTHFGFRTVPESQKQDLGLSPSLHANPSVGDVFSSVARKYDVMNDIMSLYTHRLWKDHFVRTLNPGSPDSNLRILDVAGGTGDIAFRLLEHATELNGDNTAQVSVIDINENMLKYGRRKVSRGPMQRWSSRITFDQDNAETLSTVASSSVDLYTIAFGIRNVTHIDAVLSSAYRVLKPGGVFACLEFSRPTNDWFAEVYERYSFTLLPLMGQIVAGDRDAYQYLVESIRRFPRQEEFAGMISRAGFQLPGRDGDGRWENLTGGIVAIHRGIKV